MRVFADRLVEQLAKQLHPTYLIFGNEPLLLQESRQAIQKAAHQQGFEEDTDLQLIARLTGTWSTTAVRL
jgi:DNA polymerase III delta subunit